MSLKEDASHFQDGNTVKLREHPKASATKYNWKQLYGQVNSLGYGKNVEDTTMGNPQPSPKHASAWMLFTD